MSLLEWMIQGIIAYPASVCNGVFSEFLFPPSRLPPPFFPSLPPPSLPPFSRPPSVCSSVASAAPSAMASTSRQGSLSWRFGSTRPGRTTRARAGTSSSTSDRQWASWCVREREREREAEVATNCARGRSTVRVSLRSVLAHSQAERGKKVHCSVLAVLTSPHPSFVAFMYCSHIDNALGLPQWADRMTHSAVLFYLSFSPFSFVAGHSPEAQEDSHGDHERAVPLPQHPAAVPHIHHVLGRQVRHALSVVGCDCGDESEDDRGVQLGNRQLVPSRRRLGVRRCKVPLFVCLNSSSICGFHSEVLCSGFGWFGIIMQGMDACLREGSSFRVWPRVYLTFVFFFFFMLQHSVLCGRYR